jgi:hypothetical protein
MGRNILLRLREFIGSTKMKLQIATEELGKQALIWALPPLRNDLGSG